MKKILSMILTAMLAFGAVPFAAAAEETSLPKIDMTKWQYEASDDVYWQVGLSYAATPAEEMTSREFPYSDQGLDDAVAWLNEELDRYLADKT